MTNNSKNINSIKWNPPPTEFYYNHSTTIKPCMRTPNFRIWTSIVGNKVNSSTFRKPRRFVSLMT